MSTLSVPSHTGCALRGVALGLLAVAAVLIALVAGGAFDPRPCGPLGHRDTPGRLVLAERGETLRPQSTPFAGAPRCYTVRLTAAYTDGETDSGYGLAVGDGQEALVVAVSPLGQAAVWQTLAGEDEPRYLLPWQPWPHVNTGTTPNEMWLEIEDKAGITQVTARINRELLWQGNLVEPPDTGAALWLGSFGGPVSVDFQTLDWFLPPPT